MPDAVGPTEGEVDVTVTRSDRRSGMVWVFFENVWDATNLNPAEEQQTAWEAHMDGFDDPVGMAVVDTIPTTAFISRIAVVEEARERGVGTALIESLQETYGELACRVRTNNTAGQALVESTGFEQCESRFPSLDRYEMNPDTE